MALKDLFRKKTVNQILKQVKTREDEHGSLNRVLTVRDLTALGIAAIIGAGIFSTVGKACFDGGPAVIFLFIIVGIACGFSALCYADFASRIPVAGSAYTYAYAAFGELIAWIIGWDLIMEYAIGNITVAISWSGNLTSFMHNIGVDIPGFLSTSFLAAKNAHTAFLDLSLAHETISDNIASLNTIWLSAPRIADIPFILNIPSLLITVFITALVYIGIRESRSMSNLMVLFKLIVIVMVIIVGIYYVNPANWNPFVPNGMSGVMKGVSAVFFAYIGFDAISTTAEECKNPQRDLPRGMFYSLIICTVLYIAIALVLTGMVNYAGLDVPDFLANAFNTRGLNWIGGIIALSAVVATTSVLLVFQIGQPRIWMSMSRDGLLPKRFAKLHPKFKTPAFSTIIAGCLVGIPSLILDSDLVTDLCSIGTLFAFGLVCGGILMLQNDPESPAGKFKVPFIPSRMFAPLILALVVVLVLKFNGDRVQDFFQNRTLKDKTELAKSMTDADWNAAGNIIYGTQIIDSTIPLDSVKARVGRLSVDEFETFARDVKIDEQKKFTFGWSTFSSNIPMWVFIFASIALVFVCVKKQLSLIPVLGLTSCLYLMTELGTKNWLRFVIWLIIGLIIYFMYSRKNSKLKSEL